MTSHATGKPADSEYGAYFGRYIALVDDPDVIEALEMQMRDTQRLIGGMSEDTGNSRYAAGKWSIKEVLGHVVDTERVFAYRALRFARNDSTELPGYDQDLFAANANYANVPLAEILQEYEAVRHSTLFLFRHLASDAWNRRGIANKNAMTVRALAFTIAGHELHHRAILNSRYL